MLLPGGQGPNIEVSGSSSVELKHPGGIWLLGLDDVEILRDLHLGTSFGPESVPAGSVVVLLWVGRADERARVDELFSFPGRELFSLVGCFRLGFRPVPVHL